MARFPRRAPTQGRPSQVDHSASFARHFAHLVWLVMNEAANVDDQKMALRALVIMSKGGAVVLAGTAGQLDANEQRVPWPLMGVREVVTQMIAHSLERIEFGESAPPAEILAMARLIASPATAGDGGEAITLRIRELAPTRITITTGTGAAPKKKVPKTEPATPAVTEQAAQAPSAPAADVPADASAPVEPAATPPAPVPEPAPSAPAAPVASDVPTVVAPIEERREPAGKDAAALFQQLAAKDVTKLTPEELFGRLDRAKTNEERAQVLEDLGQLAEHSGRAAKPAVVATIMHEIVVREQRAKDPVAKSAFSASFRRLSKPALLRVVAGLVARRPERKQVYYDILARAGEDGADVMIEQITQATTAKDRAQYIEVFHELDEAIPSLVRMLSDSRWFVARNAADLLGELGARQAEPALIQLLRHGDDRVRRSATTALVKLGTPEAVKAVYEAVGDESPEVRMQAAAAMSTRRDARTSNTLIRAIEGEQDNDVQLALVAALGRVGTPEAIQKLVKMAEPEGRLFRKKDIMLRVAAVQALGEARTPAALAALKDLATDKEREVRETATRALAQIQR